MPSYIALLRGINVGGHRMVAMADLRAFLVGLGLEDVVTLLQSGNVVFKSKAKSAAKLEQLLETEAARLLELSTPFIVRSAEEWREAVAANPFPDQAKKDPARLAVMFAKDKLSESRVEELRKSIRGPEIIGAAGKQLYAIYPDGMGRSKLTINLVEAKLGTRVTARNWNTVLKLRELL